MEGTSSRFTGFGEDALAFFEGIEQNNSKAYFDANRSTYQEQIREPLELLLEEVAARIPGTIKIFRPNRDIRFSKDKSPYKTAAYGVVMPSESAAGIYAAIDSTGFVTGTGYYGMQPDQLERFREAIDSPHGEPLPTIVADIKGAGLSIAGSSLKTAPRGYPKDHDRIELLRMKEIWMMRRLDDRNAVATRAPYDFVIETWQTAAPLIEWLDRHVGPSTTGERTEKPT